jgi:SAM-dependent methyltransferase
MPERQGFDFEQLFEPQRYLHFYDETLTTENTPGQIDFIERQLQMVPPLRVLDLGCGHGRHALEFARRGYEVVGIDLMSGFLSLAREQAQRESLEVEFVQGDLRTMDYSAVFDRAVCLFDAFGFFTDDENEQILSNIARSLRPGGSLCLDLRNRDWMVRNLLPTTVLQKGSDLMIDRHMFDTVTGRLVDHRLMVHGGVVAEVPFSIRLYTFTEIRTLLRGAGLTVREAFGDFQGNLMSMQRNRMVVIADKSSQ